jgi:hypothetical protein
MIQKAMSTQSIKDRAIAISIGLNTAHVTGGFTEYLGLINEDLKELSNLNSTPWDEELKRISLQKNWYRTGVKTKEEEDEAQRKAEEYFSIGHGAEDDEDFDNHEDDALWIYNRYDGFQSITMKENEGIFTHNGKWGDVRINRSWKGRYDSEQNVVSVVSPDSEMEYNIPIPQQLYSMLKKEFPQAEIKCFYCQAGNNSWYRRSQYRKAILAPEQQLTDFEQRTKQYSKPFYSRLQKELESKLPSVAPAQEIKNILLSPKLQVSQEEIEWSGILEWLDGQGNNRIPKKDILDFLTKNQIKIKETPPQGEKELPSPLQWSDGERQEPDSSMIEEYANEYFEEELAELEQNEDFEEYRTHYENEARTKAEQRAYDTLAETSEIVYEDSEYGYKAYTDDQRTFTLLDPNGEVVSDNIKGWRQVESEAEKDALENYGESEDEFKYEGYALEGGEDYRELLLIWDNPPKGHEFNSAHWEEPNVLAHVRYDTRNVENGNSLFIEEIQSDWHEEGREKGYISWKESKKMGEEYLAALDEFRRFHPTKDEFDSYGILPNDAISFGDNYFTMWLAKNIDKLEIVRNDDIDAYDEKNYLRHYFLLRDKFGDEKIRELCNIVKKYNESRIKQPKAPFPDVKSWAGLALRKIIRLAAESNYNSISWTTGDIQNERYNLTKVIDEVLVFYYKKNNENEPNIVNLRCSKNDRLVLNQNNIEESKIKDYVGFEIYQRVLKANPIYDNPILDKENNPQIEYYKFLDIENLKITTGGMNYFYDTLIPSIAKKIGKKYGVQPTSTYLPTDERYAIQEAYDRTPPYTETNPPRKIYQVVNLAFRTNNVMEQFNTLEEAQEYRDQIDKIEVHYMPITEQMKESALYEGFPLFGRKQNWYRQARYGGSEKERSIWYHGTRARNLQTILSQGLITDPKERAWAEDKNSSMTSPSRASLGGIYVTTNLMTALLSGQKEKPRDENRIIVIIQAQPRSFVADEDAFVFSLKDAYISPNVVSDSPYLLSEAYFATYLGTNQEYMNGIKENYVQQGIKSINSRLKSPLNPSLEKIVEDFLRDNWKTVLDRQVSHINRDYYWTDSFFRNIPESLREDLKEKDKAIMAQKGLSDDEKLKQYQDLLNSIIPNPPDVSVAENKFAEFSSKLTKLLKEMARPGKTERYQDTARSLTNIGFSGSNRIVGIVEVMNSRKDPYSLIRLVYGKIPEKFITDWKTAVGEPHIVDSFEGWDRGETTASEKNWYRLADIPRKEEFLGERPPILDMNYEDVQKQGLEDEWADASSAYRRKEQAWELLLMRSISEGSIDPEIGQQLGYRFHGDLEKFKPLPEVLYHVTTAYSKVLQEGLKSREELKQNYGAGLGGGPRDTVSFTSDLAVAQNIKQTILEGIKVARNEITVEDMLEMAKEGVWTEGIKKSFLKDLYHYYDYSREPDENKMPKTIKYLLRGQTLEQEGLGNKIVDMEQKGYSLPDPEDTYVWTGGDGQQRALIFARTMTDDELLTARFNLYKAFITFREAAGGPENPLFFMSDEHALAKMPEEEIQIMEFRAKPGTKGTQESALGEWRTYSGNAVEFVGIQAKNNNWYKKAQIQEDMFPESIPLEERIKALRPQMAIAAQEIYNEWEQDEEGIDDILGGGGICSEISKEIESIVVENIPGIETIEGGQDGDDHSWIIVYNENEAVGVDIPFSLYESGGGYSWKKKMEVNFKPENVEIFPLDRKEFQFESENNK